VTVYAISSKPYKGVQNVTRNITRQRTTILCHQEDCSQHKGANLGFKDFKDGLSLKDKPKDKLKDKLKDKPNHEGADLGFKDFKDGLSSKDKPKDKL